MSEHVKIHKTNTKWVVRAGGAVLGESTKALELAEGDYKPVIYFPRADIAMAFLDPTTKSTHCPHKGDANYFSIQTKSAVLENAVWSYENPLEGVEKIKGFLAFDPSLVTIEEL